ncbi:aspartate racemase [Enterobacter sp. 10-1]|uniref:aspartate/glutamate racemase family protein n=1 Tax=Raoultella sp. 10-1 TaxID=2683201 RepID=UPI000BA44D8D|nr:MULTISPECIES: aspartate/glutamate racemase family protein [Enterobacteriaceae]MVT04047.1 amino acid racemase [Raoultella sp. 10-1]PAC11654.1 aspartate racemase [Enterobacter sp. 10-1]
MSKPFLLGIVGGMGPLATLDLMHKLLRATPAESDQQQIPHVVWNVPQIADRQQALAGKGPSPLPQLLHAVEQLNRVGASHIAIACNTAHHWYEALAQRSDAPLLHIVDATLAAFEGKEKPRRVGVIATQGTLDAGWFQHGFSALGINSVLPTTEELRQLFVPGCYAVKRGELRAGGELLSLQAQALRDRGAERLVLACTEVPVALAEVASPHLAVSIDPAEALAQQCAHLWLAQRETWH